MLANYQRPTTFRPSAKTNSSSKPKQKHNCNELKLQLLDPYTCIITNFPFKLNQNIIADHELVPSIKHNGFAAKLKMLNSLKRVFEEMGLTMAELPNLSFKMFKTINPSAQSFGSKKPEQVESSCKFRKFGKSICSNIFNKNFTGMKIGPSILKAKNSITHVGKWILTPHQKRTVQYFLKRGHKILLGDQWNMGKTVTSLACLQYSNCTRILVVAPKILLSNWAWHINKLYPSLSSNSKRQQKSFQYEKYIKKEKQGYYLEQIHNQKYENFKTMGVFLQILDFEDKNEAKSYSSQRPEKYNRNVSQMLNVIINPTKIESFKNQVKLKKQQSQQSNYIHYTLCSYEHLNFLYYSNSPMDLKLSSYSGLILDQPQIAPQVAPESQKPQPNPISINKILKKQKQWKQTRKSQENLNPRRLCQQNLRQLRKIENIVICKNCTIEQTRYYLPVLNPKVEWEEIRSRYGDGELRNRYEYCSAVDRNYYVRNLDYGNFEPNGLIKRVILPQMPGSKLLNIFKREPTTRHIVMPILKLAKSQLSAISQQQSYQNYLSSSGQGQGEAQDRARSRNKINENQWVQPRLVSILHYVNQILVSRLDMMTLMPQVQDYVETGFINIREMDIEGVESNNRQRKAAFIYLIVSNKQSGNTIAKALTIKNHKQQIQRHKIQLNKPPRPNQQLQQAKKIKIINLYQKSTQDDKTSDPNLNNTTNNINRNNQYSLYKSRINQNNIDNNGPKIDVNLIIGNIDQVLVQLKNKDRNAKMAYKKTIKSYQQHLHQLYSQNEYTQEAVQSKSKLLHKLKQGHIQQYQYSKYYQSNKIAIICDSLRPADLASYPDGSSRNISKNSRSQQQLYQLFGLVHKLQYLQHSTSTAGPKGPIILTQQQSLVRSLTPKPAPTHKNTVNSIALPAPMPAYYYKPRINASVYVDRVLLEGQYISSEGSEGECKRVNPQRYNQSNSNGDSEFELEIVRPSGNDRCVTIDIQEDSQKNLLSNQFINLSITPNLNPCNDNNNNNNTQQRIENIATQTINNTNTNIDQLLIQNSSSMHIAINNNQQMIDEGANINIIHIADNSNATITINSNSNICVNSNAIPNPNIDNMYLHNENSNTISIGMNAVHSNTIIAESMDPINHIEQNYQRNSMNMVQSQGVSPKNPNVVVEEEPYQQQFEQNDQKVVKTKKQRKIEKYLQKQRQKQAQNKSQLQEKNRQQIMNGDIESSVEYMDSRQQYIRYSHQERQPRHMQQQQQLWRMQTGNQHKQQQLMSQSPKISHRSPRVGKALDGTKRSRANELVNKLIQYQVQQNQPVKSVAEENKSSIIGSGINSIDEEINLNQYLIVENIKGGMKEEEEEQEEFQDCIQHKVICEKNCYNMDSNSNSIGFNTVKPSTIPTHSQSQGIPLTQFINISKSINNRQITTQVPVPVLVPILNDQQKKVNMQKINQINKLQVSNVQIVDISKQNKQRTHVQMAIVENMNNNDQGSKQLIVQQQKLAYENKPQIKQVKMKSKYQQLVNSLYKSKSNKLCKQINQNKIDQLEQVKTKKDAQEPSKTIQKKQIGQQLRRKRRIDVHNQGSMQQMQPRSTNNRNNKRKNPIPNTNPNTNGRHPQNSTTLQNTNNISNHYNLRHKQAIKYNINSKLRVQEMADETNRSRHNVETRKKGVEETVAKAGEKKGETDGARTRSKAKNQRVGTEDRDKSISIQEIQNHKSLVATRSHSRRNPISNNNTQNNVENIEQVNQNIKTRSKNRNSIKITNNNKKQQPTLQQQYKQQAVQSKNNRQRKKAQEPKKQMQSQQKHNVYTQKAKQIRQIKQKLNVIRQRNDQMIKQMGAQQYKNVQKPKQDQLSNEQRRRKKQQIKQIILRHNQPKLQPLPSKPTEPIQIESDSQQISLSHTRIPAPVHSDSRPIRTQPSSQRGQELGGEYLSGNGKMPKSKSKNVLIVKLIPQVTHVSMTKQVLGGKGKGIENENVDISRNYGKIA